MARRRTYKGSLTRRGAAWRIRLCVGGKYHSYTVRGTRTDAENFSTSKYAELTGEAERVRAGKPAAIRFSDLLTEFESNVLPHHPRGTQESYKLSFSYFRKYFKSRVATDERDPIVGAITRADVTRYLEWRARQPRKGAKDAVVSAHTLARDRRVLSVVFSYAIKKEYRDSTPTYKVDAPKGDRHDPVLLSDAELERLLAKCATRPMLHLYVLFLAETGARAYSEALQMRWEDIDFDGGFIRIRSAPTRRTKSGKSRTLPITERLREALIAHALRFRAASYNGQASPFVFHHDVTSRTALAGARIRTMKNAFKSALIAAELPTVTRLHDLRHRRVTTFLAANHSPALVQDYMGHASLATTMGYKHLIAEHLRSLVSAPAPSGPATPAAADVVDITQRMAAAS